MKKEGIRLCETMTERRRWSWETPGIYVEVENIQIPSDATNIKTFVLKLSCGAFSVGIEYTPSDSSTTIVRPVALIHSSEELVEKFPKLFELTGSSVSS